MDNLFNFLQITSSIRGEDGIKNRSVGFDIIRNLCMEIERAPIWLDYILATFFRLYISFCS